jgi:hypothetical protein
LTRVAIPEYPWDFERLESAGKSLTLTFTAFLVLVWATWKYLPKTPFLQGLFYHIQKTQRQDTPFRKRKNSKIGLALWV